MLAEKSRASKEKKRRKLYSEDWDAIRRRVYVRDYHQCVLCGKKGRVHAHHIIPVAISKDNSMSNLVTTCGKCHKKLEAIGFKILGAGGHRTDVRRVELKMIVEARRKRLAKRGQIGAGQGDPAHAEETKVDETQAVPLG